MNVTPASVDKKYWITNVQLSPGIERPFARPTRQDFLSGIGLISGEAYENQTIQLEHTMNKRFHIFMSLLLL